MDPIIYKRTHKRIRELNQFEETQGGVDPIGTLMSSSVASKWCTAFDARDSSVEPDDSYSVPLSRLILLSPNRKVPAAFLPSSVSSGELLVTRTYSGSGDPRECLPNVGEQYYGNMNLIFKVERSGQPDAFYRYAYTDSMDIQEWYDVYHSLSDRHGFSNGQGTVVSDTINPSTGAYHRQIDINIGTPAAHTDSILSITSRKPYKLVHTLSQNTNVDAPVPASEPALSFGGSLYTPTLTVDSTGHVSSIVQQSYTLPHTPAEKGTNTDIAGLVRIGNSSTSIGTQKSAGHTSVDSEHPYILVSAADHKHDMAKLAFVDSNADISYQGMTDVPGVGTIRYDFNHIVQATLPSAPLSAGQFVLTADSATTQSNYGSTRWSTIDNALPNQESIGSGTAVMRTVASSLGSIGSLVQDGIYLVTMNIMVEVTGGVGAQSVAPVPTLHELELTIGNHVEKITIPGSWTCTALPNSGMRWLGMATFIMKAAGTAAPMSGRMPAQDTTYDGVFTVTCGAIAERLR